VTIDLAAQTVAAGDSSSGFEIDAFTKHRLLEGLDDIGLTLRHIQSIEIFEAARPGHLPSLLHLCGMELRAVISYPPIPIFEVGPLGLSLHGVFAGVGFMAGAYYGLRMFHARGFDATRFQSALTWALVGALLGARWLTLPAYWVENGFDISEMINIGGNYSILGGFAGGIGLGVFRAYRLGLRIWPTLDVTAFGLAIGTIVGRIGDLAIVEHLGGPTDFFLGYGIRPGYDVAPQHNRLECAVAEVGEYCGIYHHAAFYDMLDCHIDKTVFIRCLFGKFRLNGSEIIGNQFNDLLKAGHNSFQFSVSSFQ